MIRSYSWLIISPPESSNTSAGSRLMMSSMFLAITSVSAGVAARLAGASAALEQRRGRHATDADPGHDLPPPIPLLAP